MSIENPISNEELEKAYALNSLVDGGVVNRETASKFTGEEVDRFAGYFKELVTKPEIKMKEGKFAERSGYPSDECFVIVRQGQDVAVFHIGILEHFQGDSKWDGRLKRLGEELGDDGKPVASLKNKAINYKPGLEKSFEAVISEKHMTADEANAEVEKVKASLIEIELQDGGDSTKLKAVHKIAQDYQENFERYQRERIEEAEQVKRFAIDLMRKNNLVGRAGRDEALKNIQRMVLKVGQEHGMHYVAAINFLVFALKEPLQIPSYDYDDEDMIKKLYEPIEYLISIFGPQDSLRQIDVYNASLRKNFGFKDSEPEMPEDLLFQGCRVAEVGGNYVRKFKRLGAEVVCPERYFGTHEHGSIKTEESQITLANYEQHYPGQFNITISRQVMEFGSGIQTGFSSEKEGAQDLLAAFANMTKKGGISIHNGNYVPTDEKYLQALGLELIFSIQPKRGGEPFYIFLKTGDKKITKKDILEASLS